MKWLLTGMLLTGLLLRISSLHHIRHQCWLLWQSRWERLREYKVARQDGHVSMLLVLANALLLLLMLHPGVVGASAVAGPQRTDVVGAAHDSPHCNFRASKRPSHLSEFT
jgi:hypothetical protein